MENMKKLVDRFDVACESTGQIKTICVYHEPVDLTGLIEPGHESSVEAYVITSEELPVHRIDDGVFEVRETGQRFRKV